MYLKMQQAHQYILWQVLNIQVLLFSTSNEQQSIILYFMYVFIVFTLLSFDPEVTEIVVECTLHTYRFSLCVTRAMKRFKYDGKTGTNGLWKTTRKISGLQPLYVMEDQNIIC
jgi:hypothetical protein